MKMKSVAIAGLLCLGQHAVAQADLQCNGTLISGAGVITSSPAGAADVAGCTTAYASFPSPDPLYIAPNGQPVCQVIETSGTAKLTGYSLITSSTLVGADGAATSTPGCFPFDPVRGCGTVGDPASAFPPGSAGMTVFTSQAVLSGSLNGKKYQGTVFTKDTGAITASGFVGQVLQIVGGTGDFAGASGLIGLHGQELGGFASYSVSICIN